MYTHAKQRIRTVDDFEHDYYERYGIYFDHDREQLLRTHSPEEVQSIIAEKVRQIYDFEPCISSPF